jgi:hypothetical protein
MQVFIDINCADNKYMMLTKTGYTVPKELMDRTSIDPKSIDEKFTINTPTGNFFYDPWEIKPEFKNTIWNEILETLPYPKGEARLLVLDSGKNYFGHADIDDRWHLNICGTYSFLVDLDTNMLHKTDNDMTWYLMDAGRLHSAANFGDKPRVQLVVRKLLNRSTKDLVSIQITPTKKSFDTRYRFDQTLSPWLNRASKNGDIDNFQITSNGVQLDLAVDRINELLEVCGTEFLTTILGTC